jgi:hypothetical protein
MLINHVLTWFDTYNYKVYHKYKVQNVCFIQLKRSFSHWRAGYKNVIDTEKDSRKVMDDS